MNIECRQNGNVKLSMQDYTKHF